MLLLFQCVKGEEENCQYQQLMCGSMGFKLNPMAIRYTLALSQIPKQRRMKFCHLQVNGWNWRTSS
jgi:hypothetical protein